MLGMLSQWLYGGSPFDAIRFEKPLQELKADLEAKKPVFQDLLKKYVLANSHRVTVEMRPVEGLDAKQEQEEVSRLADVKSSLSEAELLKIVEDTKVLKAAQLAEDSEEAKASIPRLTLDDIDPRATELPISVVADGKDGGVTVLTHEVPSNGILYLDLALDYSDVLDEDLPYLPLFSR